MIKQIYIAALLLSWIIAAHTTYAQNVTEDLQRIEQRYATTERLTAEMVYRVYANNKAEDPLQTEDGKVIKKGSKTYQKIGPMETLTTPDYQLVTDHSNQLIVLSQGVENNNALTGVSTEQLRELLKLCKDITYEVLNDRQAQYMMQIPSGEYQQVALVFDRQDFWLNKITLFYRYPQALSGQTGPQEAPRVEIDFTQISTKKRVNDDIFAYNNLLNKSHNQYSLTKEYEHYRLINQLR